MSRRLPVIEIPNVPTVPPGPERTSPRPDGISRLAMVGRIAPQKDPRFYADAVGALRESGVVIEAVWIGDGEGALRRLLAEAGIRVTGWLSPARVRDLLHGAVYVHSARYEGFPLSLLDAAACGAPIVARRIAAVEHTDLLMSDAPEQAAALVTDLLRSEDALAAARARGAHSPQRLTEALTVLYSEALK